MDRSTLPYSIGCPVWSCREWKGTIYPERSDKSDWLRHYSRKFNTVEGNTTFYGIPAAPVVKRWCDQTEDGFRFVLKFPGSITHEKQLVQAETETETFLKCLEILHQAKRLGPTFLQLGPQFGSNQFADLVAYLRKLPGKYPFAVEVRHPDYFASPFEGRLNELLRERQMDRVIFDSRPLYSMPPADSSEKRAQGRKPKSPVRITSFGNRPVVRLIGRNRWEETEPWLESWADQVIQWIQAGKHPYLFMHTPDDAFAPWMVHGFHRKLQERYRKNEPGQLPGLPPLGSINKQKMLF